MAIKRFVDNVLKVITVALVAAICLVVILQILTRFILNNPSSWSEEISRYLLIWITFLGGSMGLTTGAHMGLVVVTEKIESEKIQLVLHIFAYAVCALIGYIFVRYGYIYTLSGMKRTMMCCKIPIGYVYMIMPFSGLVIVINSIEMIVKGIRTLARGERRNG